jgi:PAS domain S-box-containing protein
MDLPQNSIDARSRKLIITLPIGVFLAEVIAMILVRYYEGPYLITILLDAIITMTLMFPLIYVISYKPLLKHIRKRERSERILQARFQLMQFAVSHTVDELLQATLDEIEVLTGSTIGFFHFLETDQRTLKLQAWSSNTVENMCKAEGKGSHYDLDKAGVWADSVRQRQPIIHDNYALLLNRQGLPKGHAPIIRELSVPILREDQVVAIIGVGNKPTDFTSEDVDLVSTLADFVWDIIDRKRSEDALRQAEEKFRTLVDWTYDWEKWIDPQGNIVYTSPSSKRITGYSPEEIISNPQVLSDIVHPDDRMAYDAHRLLLHEPKTGANNMEYRIIARDGSERWIEHICRPLFGKDGHYLGRRISSRDITQRKLAEMEIRERSRKEALLTETIHNMQINVARDLHDTVGQNISYIRMKLDQLSDNDLRANLNLHSEIDHMLEVANESYNLIRGTLTILQSGGLTDLLTVFIKYANQIGERSSFKIDVSCQGESRPLSPNQVRQLFFVFREALSNIEKHADASKVSVELIWADDNFDLVIADDGKGFRQDDAQISDHYGLKFMQERIEAVNGVFSVQSMNKHGTNIKISLPYQ